MGQAEVYEFFRKNPGKWFTCREVKEALGVSMSSASRCLKKIRYELEYKTEHNTFIYKFKEES